MRCSLKDMAKKLLAPDVLMVMTLLTCGLIHPASAEIYWFTDENGVAHFSNVPTDERYVPLKTLDPPIAEAAIPGIADRRSNAPVKVQYAAIIDEIARTYGLESALIHAVVSVESAYNARALSRKGAAGLMQLMPETARRYGVTDRFDPMQNLSAGGRHLSGLLKMFDGNMGLALAAYNAGEKNVVKYGNRIPPFQETQNYVPKVLGLYQRYRAGIKLVQSQQGV
jgi:soluble lytic murein transglycosylase-like protein